MREGSESKTNSLIEQCLRYAVHREVAQTNLRDYSYNRDVIIGLIGDRGGGKSGGGAQVCGRDFMIRGEPCFSNIGLSFSFDVPDEIAVKWGSGYGVTTGGQVQYQAEPLDINRFLAFDEVYKGGVIFIDEINIALADARRSMSFQNLGAADIGQQLRKLQSALVYTCINEAYVDIRIRDLTDFMIRTKDAAYVDDGMPHKREGEFFHWTIYPMTDKAAAIVGTYKKFTGKPDGGRPLYLTVRGREWWGSIDTWEHQQRRKYTKESVTASELGEGIVESSNIVIAKRDWGWLEKVANRIVALGQEDSGKVLCSEVMEWPEVLEHKLPQSKVSEELNRRFNIWSTTANIRGSGGRKAQHYVVSDAVMVDV